MTNNNQNASKLLALNQNRFEDYLVQALNESLMKKSKLYFLIIVSRWHQVPQVWELVDWKPRKELDYRHLQARWRATWNNYQGYQVLCQGDILWRKEKPRTSNWLLGPLCWMQSRHFRKNHHFKTMWFKDSWVESVLRFFPDRDEEHFHRRAQEIREKGIGRQAH